MNFPANNLGFRSLRRIPAWVWLLALSGVSLGLYLLASQIFYRVGFPLDDAWIHQTYARNLAQTAEFAYIQGQPSAGSTAPLWTALLALGYLLNLPYLAWAFFLGWLALWGLSCLGGRYFNQLCGQESSNTLWVGAFLALEWHLVWAAGSGMETLLYGFLAMLAIFIAAAQPQGALLSGCVVGLCLWLRPDGVTLLGPVLWAIIFSTGEWKKRFTGFVQVLAGASLFLLPYLGFNWRLAGSIWPNTFSAKQAEYAVLAQAPLLQRIWEQAQLPLIGAGVLLLPGVILALLEVSRQKKWRYLGGLLWVVGMMLVYAWRLPVTYQHGRYLIPIMPVFFVWGMAGVFQMQKRNADLPVPRILARAWLAALFALQFGFLYLGAKSYAQDVAFIESEMVTTSHWVSENTGADEIVAAHDIGALGYFSGRELVDLAGLISPEVIPFLRDESRLAQYLSQKGVDYLVTFPGWYPQLTAEAEMVYTTGEGFSLQQGGENMAVFRWFAR